MKRGLYRFAAVASLLLTAEIAWCAAGGYTPAPFSDYQPILDRMPFGALPANFNPAAAEQTQTDAQVEAQQQQLAKQVSMSCVNITPDGSTAVGFTDLSEKPPQNYYLRVGSDSRGWNVLAADYDGEWAQLEKDGVTITLKLGQGLIDGPPVAAAPAVADAPGSAPLSNPVSASPVLPRPAAPVSGGRVLRPYHASPSSNASLFSKQLSDMQKTQEEINKLKESGGDVTSYMDRLRERKAQEKADKAAAEEAARKQLQDLAQKITQDELKKREREVNLNLIQQGARPVSDIELTPEEEAALVERGALAQ